MVAAFQARHADFTTLPITAVWAETLGTAGIPCPSAEPVLHLRPDQHGTDGFFVAVLARQEPTPRVDTEAAGDG